MDKFKKIVVVEGIKITKEEEDKIKSMCEQYERYDDFPTDKEVIAKRIEGADAIVVGVTQLTEKMLEKNPQLKYISIWATGYNCVPVEYAKKRGIVVTNIPQYAAEAVAEFVIGQLLGLMRHSTKLDKDVREGNTRWDFIRMPLGNELAGKSIGIVGLGAIGKRVADIAFAFNMKVKYFDIIKSEEYEKKGVEFCSVEDILKQCDIVTLHLILNKKTKGMINAEKLALMKPGAILVNMSRGAVIEEKALLDALNRDRIKAILDVYPSEPKSATPEIRNAKNTLLSPHHAWYTEEALKRRNKIFIDNMKGYLNGKPQNVVS